MRRFFLFILLSLFSFAVQSQITVNTIGLSVGDEVIQVTDSLFQTELHSSGGADLSWDFAGLHGEFRDTIAPIDPTTTNHASTFPTSNLAIGTVELAAYFSNTNDAYTALGYGGLVEEISADIEMNYIENDVMIAFPINYTNERTTDAYGTTNATVDIPNVGETDIRISESIHREQEVDAWGTVTTPEGEYEVLRVKEYKIQIDSIFAYMFGIEVFQEDYSQFDTSYTFNYYTNDVTIKTPLLVVNYNPSSDEIISSTWITFTEDTAIPNLVSNKTEISIYPNPAKNFINIETNEDIISVNIYNTVGQLVKNSSQRRVNISDLPSSIYIIEVNTKNKTTTERLIIK